MADEASTGASVREWTDILRRVRFGDSVKGMRGSMVKLVARTLATYADGNGTRVFPGIARLTVDCEINYQTAKKAVGVLRDLGLITPVRHGTRRGHADEYRLTIPVDLLDRLDVLSPAEFDVAVEKVRGANRSLGGRAKGKASQSGTGGATTRTESQSESARYVGRAPVRVPRPPVPPVDSAVDEAVDNEEVQVASPPVQDEAPKPGTGDSSTPTDSRTGGSSVSVRVAHSPPTIQDLDTTPTSHLLSDRRKELAVSPARASEDRFSEVGCGGCEKGYVWPSNADGSITGDGLPAYCPTCQPGLATHGERLAQVIPIKRGAA